MPVPTNIDPASAPPVQPAQKSQKSMTKAERRELQERQRAAKIAQKTPTTSGAINATPSKSKLPLTPSQKKPLGDVHGGGTAIKSSQVKDPNANIASSAGPDDGMGGRNVSRGLRIFSHFGLSKSIGHAIKGDIHPAIIRLRLLFSDFRICGANARCIATLTAFKTVCSFPTGSLFSYIY